MQRSAFLLVLLTMIALVSPTTPTFAARPSEGLLPSTTKGYISVPDVELLRQSWELTQLGLLTQDPLMKPFMDDLRELIKSRLDKSQVQLSLKLDDLKDVYGGEVCFAVDQPNNDPKQHALAVVVDITGKRQEAAKLLDKVASNMAAKGATKTVENLQGVPVTTYTLPKKRGETIGQRVFYFLRDDRLVATDHEVTVKAILARFAGRATDSLESLPAFKQAMSRCQQAPDVVTPQVRWFVEPFGYAQTSRAASVVRRKRGTDMLKVLSKQGFTAVQGIGGHVVFAAPGKEVLHKTFIYAPAVNKTGDKYKLAMRMMNFPKSEKLVPQDWTLRNLASYLTFNWKMREAFESLQSLVDEIAGAPIFEDVIASLERDPTGPRIKVREGFINHLGERATFLTSYRLPVTPQCERWLFAVEVTNPAEVAKTLEKVMKIDVEQDLAKRWLIGKQVVWEVLDPEEKEAVKKPKGTGSGLNSKKKDEDEERDEVNPLFKHAALTVVNGHLLIASHIDFLQELLNRPTTESSLAKEADYLAVHEALAKIGAGKNSFRYFARTDKAYHPTYELIRQGKMPEAETLFGALLNRWFAPDEEGVIREQQIDGKKLPDYAKVRSYFGPAGLFVDTEDDGWFIAGCLLKNTDGVKPTVKPETKPEPQPEATSEIKPEAKPQAKPEAEPAAESREK